MYEKLYFELAHALKGLNYEPILARRQFRQHNESGYRSIVLSGAGKQSSEISVFLGIRINMVEDLVYQFTEGLQDYGLYSTTLLVPAKNITSKSQYFYLLNTESDIPEILHKIMKFLNEEGFKFLEEYSSVKALNELYNQPPNKKLAYITNEFHRALRGIVLAKLTQRPHWTELVGQYRSKLQKQGLPEARLQKYEQLARFLTNYSFS